ncbi:hypothetical protein BDZ45DRAFT_684255 [Acephala macrosclerotiorum]|nr:hypothetical protein BDZ45DRAFT_684255 [Acephala macrosclerotiorum]
MLAQQQEKRLVDVVPFPYFNNLLFEIRRIIWDLSLPGPRTLCASAENGEKYMGYNWEENPNDQDKEEEQDEDFHAHPNNRPFDPELWAQNYRILGLPVPDLDSIKGNRGRRASLEAGPQRSICQ